MSENREILRKLKELFKDEPLSYPDLEKYYIETEHHMGSEKEGTKSIFLTSENSKLIIGKKGTGKTTSLKKTLVDLEKKGFTKISIEAPNPLGLDAILSEILKSLTTTLQNADLDFPTYLDGMSVEQYILLLGGHSVLKEKGKTTKKGLGATIAGGIAGIFAKKESSTSDKTSVSYNKITLEEKKTMLCHLLEYIFYSNLKFAIGIDHIFIPCIESNEIEFSNAHETITNITYKAGENLQRTTTYDKIIYLFIIDTNIESERLKDAPRLSLSFDVVHEMDYINIQEAEEIVNRRLEDGGMTLQDTFTNEEFNKIYEKSEGNLGKLIKLVLRFIILKVKNDENFLRRRGIEN